MIMEGLDPSLIDTPDGASPNSGSGGAPPPPVAGAIPPPPGAITLIVPSLLL